MKKSGVAPEGATPRALTPMTFPFRGLEIKAWGSPPQLRTSYMVHTAASMAHEASTAFPPARNILAPAVAANGLPVMATQFRPCSTGFSVRADETGPGRKKSTSQKAVIQAIIEARLILASPLFSVRFSPDNALP